MTFLPAGSPARTLAAAILLAAAASCSGAPDAASTDTTSEPMAHEGMSGEVVIPDGVLYTAADVRFMQGMIAHHAQAVYMTHLATTRGASSRLLTFAQKIDQSQTAEIALMQGWLSEKNQAVPDTASYHSMMMPGMLTAEQLEQLRGAQGTDFDRLFLELMIQHHQGAIQMVADLMANPRAAQDVDVNVFANDVRLVQTTEIELMREMLSDLQSRAPSP